MRKRKYTFYVFQENETAAFAEYLEGMAANGWMLKTVMRNTIQCFERHEPLRLKFSVAVLPDSSEFESRDREEAVTFRAYCEEAGWKLLYGGTLWQIFYSEEEDPIPIETDPRVQLEVQKDLMLSKGRWIPCLLLTGFFLFGIWMMLKEPGRLFASASDTVLLVCLVALMMIFPVGFLSRVLWLRKAERRLRREGVLPSARLPYVKKRSIVVFAVLMAILLLVFAVSGNTVWESMLSLAQSLVMITICILVLGWIREHGQGDRRENLIGYLVGGAAICLIVTPVIMYPLRTLIPEKPPVEEYRRLGEFPAGFEVLGFAPDPTWHRESERSCLSFYQTETGTKVDADGKAFWLHMTYYESPVSLIIAGTKGYYPREKGNVWDVEETTRLRENGISVTRYRYELKPGNEWVDEPPVQDTYLLSDRNRLFVLSFTKAAGEAELERAIELFAGGEGSDL